MCFRKHRESKALAECQATYVMMYSTPVTPEAKAPEVTPEAKATEPREATWTEKRGDSGRYWTNTDGWVVFRAPDGFDLRDLDDNRYGVYGLLSNAIDASEAIDSMEHHQAETAEEPKELASWLTNVSVHAETAYAVVHRTMTACGPMTGLAHFTTWMSAQWFVETQLPAVGGELVMVTFK